MATSTIMRYSRPLGVTSLNEAMDQVIRDAFTWPRFFSRGAPQGAKTGLGLNSNLYETPKG